ncbi:nuclear transport factor 2 family protein [Nocardia australiensis]|uniref:nuclear transport factor 2 family protein n=1 Tax=Nocardia australiensis TaxID=2887191 RepID=UPI001D148D44|nr:nuclear transport factor 2 family protein [Nocardia australiensis]
MDIDIDIDQLVDRYVAVWNESDPIARRRAISELWHPDGVETTESARYHGHDALETRITEAHTEEFLRRLGEGAPDRIAELFAERVDWQLDWPDSGHPAVPWIRPRFTRADVADHFREIAAFHVPEKSAGTVSRVLIDGTEAVLLGDIRQTVKATGKPYTAPCALHLTVQDGLITRYAVYEDSLTVTEALANQPVHR